jgi:hypothetical protein
MPAGATQAPAAPTAATHAMPVATPAAGAAAAPKAPAKRPRGDRIDRLWRRLERLDDMSDKLREQLVGFGPAGDGAAPAAGLAPADAPLPVRPAEQLSTPELIESLRRVEADQARVLGALETRLRSLDQPPAQTAAPAPTPDPAVPVGGAPQVAGGVAVANGAPPTTPAAGDESAAHIRELERLEEESDRLRAALEDRVLDAEGRAAHGLPADGPGVAPVGNATTQRFIALVGELDAVDIKADRVRHALRIATSRGGAHANGAHAGGTTAGVATAAGGTAAASRGARTFRLRSRPMKGSDVRDWQVQLNKQLKELKVDHEIGVDGEYGGETARWSKRVLYALGLTSGKWQGVTPELRIKTRRPQRRTPAEVAAARRRVPWLRKLRKRYDAPKGGIRASIAYAKKHVGTRETRPNGGGLIDEWERSVGIANAAWCGAFANYCLMQGGQPARSWLKYTPWIVENAKRGVGGFSWHQKPKIGDLVLFDWPGHEWVDHVGVVIETHPDGTVTTVEGNTGPSTDRVVRQQRRTCILGYARPPWKSGER